MKKTILLLIISIFTLLLNAQKFKFVLLTDLHITQDSLAANDLHRSVDQINHTEDIGFVLVTGDITENGDGACLRKAKSILDRLRVPYYIVSGNHETKWSESGVTDFAQIYGSDRFKFEYEGVLFLGFSTGPVIRMADGHVAPQDISWLQDELRKHSKTKQVFLSTHYPVISGDVDNWFELTDAVRPYNIRAFLGGHYHRNLLLSYDGIPGFVNRSNLRGKAPVGGYSLYQVSPDSIIVYEQLIGQSPVRWGGISMKERYYSTNTSEYTRPDFSVNNQYPMVRDSWSVSIGNGIYSSPVVEGDRVYVGDDLGYLSCLSLQTGVKQWSFKAKGRIVGTPATADNVVVFGSAESYIWGIDSRNGKMIWKIATNGAVLGAVTIAKGVAYIGASDHTFRAIRIKDGKLLWCYDKVKGYVETRPLLYQGKVIFGAWDNTLYALDQQKGDLQWRWNGGLTRIHYSPAAVWPVAAHGKIFITDPQRAMTAIDSQNGATLWRSKESMVRETIGLSADQSRVYSKTMQDSVVCYSTLSEFPQKIWSCHVGFGYEHAPSMLVEKDGVVFGSTKNGLIFAIDPLTGVLLWKHKVDNSLVSTVLPLSSIKCVYSSTSGRVGVLVKF